MQAPTHRRSTESRFRLLYLGADLELVSALRKALPKPIYRLVTCSDRASAILFLKSEIPYDLLLVDFEWQNAAGLKLARLAHSLRHRKKMPIILVSTIPLTHELETLARRAGVREFVTKTPDIDATSEAILRIIEF